MDLEDTIRSRIEAILQDAKRKAESEDATQDRKLAEHDPYEEERCLYQQIINIYRGIVNGTNHRLEENLAFVSSLSRIVENIREKEDFQEICSRVVDSVLQDMGVEYCGIIFFKGPEQPENPFSLEGVREERKFLRIHSNSALLGSKEFEEAVARLALESQECVNIEDACTDPRFSNVDLPSVVRSLVCVPLVLKRITIGALILSHSQPLFFHPDRIQVSRILANTVAHVKLLTGRRSAQAGNLAPGRLAVPRVQHQRDVISIVLLDFELTDPLGRNFSVDKQSLQAIRTSLESTLEGKESLLFQGGGELLALLPGVPAEQLPHRVTRMWEAFDKWKKNQDGALQNSRVSLGFSTCEEGQNLAQALEIASLMMHPEADEELSISTQGS